MFSPHMTGPTTALGKASHGVAYGTGGVGVGELVTGDVLADIPRVGVPFGRLHAPHTTTPSSTL
jgi:hypothetical protein